MEESADERDFPRRGRCVRQGVDFLHCVTIWQIRGLQSRSGLGGNLENAQVSPISKGGDNSAVEE